MNYRRLVDGDYSFGAGTNDFVKDAGAVSQAIRTSLLLLKGEWWEDIEAGLPLFQSILGQPGTPENIQAVDLIVQENIANVQGVINIKNYKGSYINRQYSISCTVDTIYGEANVEVTF